MQASRGRSGKQQQQPNSPNHVRAIAGAREEKEKRRERESMQGNNERGILVALYDHDPPYLFADLPFYLCHYGVSIEYVRKIFWIPLSLVHILGYKTKLTQPYLLRTYLGLQAHALYLI